MVLTNTTTHEEYTFQFNGHVVLNDKSDSWRELPVLKDNPEDMLQG